MTSPSPRTVRTGLAVLALGAAALALPASAAPLPEGAVRVVAGPQASATNFLTTTVSSTVGTKVGFTNLDTTTHDVTSRATRVVVVRGKKVKRPVFSAPITPAGGTSKVVGTEKLKAGTYDFFCSLHPGMKGKLAVR